MHRLSWVALAFVSIGSPAFAEQASLPTPEEIAHKDTVTIGIGAGIHPDYEGSDDYRFTPVGAIRGRVNGISFSTRGAYLYVDVIPRGSAKVEFDAGPIVGARINKRRHIKDEVVEALPKTKTAIEVGGFAGVSVHGLTNPYDSLGLRLDVLHDVGNAHESTIFSPNIDFSTPLSRTTFVAASAGIDFVDNKYADYYYSITPAGSLASGLPVFDADGGMKSWKLGLLLNQSIGGDLLHGLSIFGAGQYSRLVGDFRRAPIVSIRGSAGQWVGAVGLAYTW
jgi:outer membrane scaffolding protein for murein synthesis (MipA/OmpV family)